MNKTGEDIGAHLADLTPERRRRDAQTLTDMLQELTGREPELWSGGIVGFGSCHYKYPTGTEGDAPILAFAPRKASTTVYLLEGVGPHSEALSRIGPHRTGVGCLYLGDLQKVDLDVLEGMFAASWRGVVEGEPGSPERHPWLDYAELTVTG